MPPDNTKGGPRAESRPTCTNPNRVTHPSLKEDFGPPTVPRQAPPGHLVHPASVQELAELLAEHDRQEKRVTDAYREGYEHGHRSGWDVGYAHAHEEIAASWVALAVRIRGYANSPTFEELQRRRAQPGGIVYERTMARRYGQGAA